MIFRDKKTGQELSIDYKCSKTTIIKLLKEQGVDVRKDKARAKLDDVSADEDCATNR